VKVDVSQLRKSGCLLTRITPPPERPGTLMTVVTKATASGKSARVGRPTWSWASLPSVRTLVSGEGMLRPPSNPRPLAPLRSTGRTGAPPPDPRTGALLAEARAVVATRVPRPTRQPSALPAPDGSCIRSAFQSVLVLLLVLAQRRDGLTPTA